MMSSSHRTFIVLSLVFSVAHCSAGESRLLFEDDFERSESQEGVEELGNGWGTNSKKRAAGNKQCDLRDGALYLSRHEVADHGVSLVHPADYVDCKIEMRFRLDDKRDDVGIDFADMTCKEVHAGHICKVMFRPSGVEMLDFKYGRMKLAYRELAKAGKATKEQQAAVAKFQRKFPEPIALKEWHHAVVTIRGETMAVELDGKSIGIFQSPGMGHEKKDMVRFSARQNAWLDDVRMVALTGKSQAKVGTTAKPVQHLFAAKLLLRRFENLDLSDKQKAEFDQLSADLRRRVDQMRSEAGITKQLIQRRDEAFADLKKREVKGDQVWTALQKELGLTDKQRDAFRKTFEANKAFRKTALELLTQEQRAGFAKTKPKS